MRIKFNVTEYSTHSAIVNTGRKYNVKVARNKDHFTSSFVTVRVNRSQRATADRGFQSLEFPSSI